MITAIMTHDEKNMTFNEEPKVINLRPMTEKEIQELHDKFKNYNNSTCAYDFKKLYTKFLNNVEEDWKDVNDVY
jgi:hypothetical protein